MEELDRVPVEVVLDVMVLLPTSVRVVACEVVDMVDEVELARLEVDDVEVARLDMDEVDEDEEVEVARLDVELDMTVLLATNARVVACEVVDMVDEVELARLDVEDIVEVDELVVARLDVDMELTEELDRVPVEVELDVTVLLPTSVRVVACEVVDGVAVEEVEPARLDVDETIVEDVVDPVLVDEDVILELEDVKTTADELVGITSTMVVGWAEVVIRSMASSTLVSSVSFGGLTFTLQRPTTCRLPSTARLSCA
jgi:hypothetical protein